MDSSKFLILGANGQLGRALAAIYPDAVKTDVHDLDITDSDSVSNYDWSNISAILNAAAYTNVDGAEAEEGKKAAWLVNDQAVANLAKVAEEKDILLVHISTEYVFDGTKGPHKEDESASPLGEYAKTKAAGDEKASKAPRHYLVRTSWVVGDGKNFVRTMIELGKKGIEPSVVSDQIGRPTFAPELAKAIDFLIKNKCPYGTYNVSNEGEPVSWADLTRAIFKEAGYNLQVTDTTTADYFKDKPQAAKRPLNSILDLSKIEQAGFRPQDWKENLSEYIKKELSQ